jgi:arginine decarboxylase
VSDKIVSTRNVTQSAIGDRDGLWTSVVAAAVFVDLVEGNK